MAATYVLDRAATWTNLNNIKLIEISTEFLTLKNIPCNYGTIAAHSTLHFKGHDNNVMTITAFSELQ
jgi:hypothetical protein